MSLASKASLVVGCWPVDEVSGTRNDSVGSNHLTDNNSVGSAAGKFSNAADFEADSGQWLSHVSNSTLQMGDIDFMLRAWVNLESKGGERNIIAKRSYTLGNLEYYLRYLDSSDRFNFEVSPDGSTPVTSVSANNFGSPSTGVWYLIHAWHDSVSNQIGISVNAGTADTASHSTGVFAGAANFSLGAISYAGDNLAFWDGLIEEPLLMKNGFLDATERTADYNGGTGVAFANWASGSSFIARPPLLVAQSMKRASYY